MWTAAEAIEQVNPCDLLYILHNINSLLSPNIILIWFIPLRSSISVHPLHMVFEFSNSVERISTLATYMISLVSMPFHMNLFTRQRL